MNADDSHVILLWAVIALTCFIQVIASVSHAGYLLSTLCLFLVLLHKANAAHTFFFFFFNDPAPTEFSPLPLPAALPISACPPPPNRCASSATSTSPIERKLTLTRPFAIWRNSSASLTPAIERGYSTIAGVRLALRSEEHTSELQSQSNLVCRLLLEKKKK